MDYHAFTKKCDGMCDSCECPPATLPDRPPTPGCRTPEGCRENGCLGWCDEHRPDGAAVPDSKTPNVRGNAHLTAAQEVEDEQK